MNLRSIRQLQLTLVIALVVSRSALAEMRFFMWPAVDIVTGDSYANPSHSSLGFDIGIDVTVNSGRFDTLSSQNPTDPTFATTYASSIPTLVYRSRNEGAGDIISTYSFSPALPPGSRLIAFDLDNLERLNLRSNDTPLVLVEQRESMAGEMSDFPEYFPASGDLVGTSLPNTENEATVFDVSGAVLLQIAFSGGSEASGSLVAIGIIPEPTALIIACSGALLSATCIRRRRRN